MTAIFYEKEIDSEQYIIIMIAYQEVHPWSKNIQRTTNQK